MLLQTSRPLCNGLVPHDGEDGGLRGKGDHLCPVEGEGEGGRRCLEKVNGGGDGGRGIANGRDIGVNGGCTDVGVIAKVVNVIGVDIGVGNGGLQH